MDTIISIVRFEHLSKGGDTLDSAIKVVTGPEDDPKDDSVGLGGLPNEEGVVELDACCMHGPSRRAGSVGGVRNIKNVSKVAKAVMEHTGHVMLVGEGAERFAVAMGFPRENLLTERSRQVWFLWKEYHSRDDWWGPGIAAPGWKAPDTSSQSELWEHRFKTLNEMAANIGIDPEFRCGRNSSRASSAYGHHQLFGVERKRRNVRHHYHQWTGIQAARSLR